MQMLPDTQVLPAPALLPYELPYRSRRAIRKVAYPFAADCMYCVTSMRFTVPTGVPALTVTWPAIAALLSSRTKLDATAVIWPLGDVKAHGADPQSSVLSLHDSIPELAGLTPTIVITMSCAGDTATVSSNTAVSSVDEYKLWNFSSATDVASCTAVFDVDTVSTPATPAVGPVP